MTVGITISNSQVYLLGFSLKKYSLQFVGNEGIYNVSKEFGKALYFFGKQNISRVSHKMVLLVKHSQT